MTEANSTISSNVRRDSEVERIIYTLLPNRWWSRYLASWYEKVTRQ